MNTELRYSLVHQADSAFLSLTGQANLLLDAAQTYLKRSFTLLEEFKHRELKSAVSEIGSLTKMLGGEVARWKKGEPRVLSKMGVEVHVLNEVFVNIESLMLFYTRENVEVPGFSLDLVRTTHSDLLRCNRLL